MERTLTDDLKWALAVFAGAIIAYLLFADGDAALLVGAFIAIVLVVVVLNVMRRLRR